MTRLLASRDGLGPGDIVLPGWLSHPDIPPGTPSPWDFEFDSAQDAHRWLDADAGSYVATSDGATPSLLSIASAHAVYIAAPPTPFTVTAKVIPNPDTIGTACDTSLAVCSGIPSANAFRSLNVDVDTVTTMTFGMASWNSRGSFNSTSIVGNVSGYALQRPAYLRWVVTSGSSIAAHFSVDGYLYETRWFSNPINPGWGSVPYVMLVSNGSRGLWDWIRFTTP